MVTAAQTLARREWLRLKAATPKPRMVPRKETDMDRINEQIRQERATKKPCTRITIEEA